MRFACCVIPTWNRTTPPRGMSGKPLASRPTGTRPRQTGWPVLRGEIRLVDLEPTQGSEANKRRPAVVVSNDRANAAVERHARGVVTVVPVTSSVERVFPFQTL